MTVICNLRRNFTDSIMIVFVIGVCLNSWWLLSGPPYMHAQEKKASLYSQ